MMTGAGLTDGRAFTEGLEVAMLALWQERTERIAVDRNHDAVAIERVNSPNFDSEDQIHAGGGSPVAIPTAHDLV